MTGGPLDTLRVDNVGSLLRPAALGDAFARHRRGDLEDTALHAAQDEAVRDVLGEQEKVGLPVLTDGEFRRSTFMESFAEVAGYAELGDNLWRAHARRALDRDAPERAEAPSAASATVATEPLRLVRNVPLEEFRFAQGCTDRPVKSTVLGPDRVFQTFDAAGSRDVYPDRWAFLDDVVAVERDIVAGLVGAGCRYVHMDAPGFTAYVDAPSIERFRAKGLDPADLLTRTLAAENAVVAGFPDTTFGVHVCRGNEQGHWHREGHYDAIAEQLFSGLAHQRILLEYDTDRAGTFEPLRFVRPGAVVVLGVVSTKSARVETVDEVVGRVEEATRHLPLEQLAISPQCGFASTLEGNDLTADDQWRKFDVLLRAAELVWG
ncbi:5-methyltetrahydropteroyltriglutamate--homocysteine S-methyltransferase [Actinomycetospora sp. NBRC 106375]|uniref:cobalamin-independent methionine synthase II family protein n=1 Tax=Actinomycetospora sp. NBRC 106375 TaxID=3032207 RepID=UPI0024A31E78|nr:cobalamin-independent methionine synthase II family protein [Actinomycetospora sp. NBRC 106375]GLZ49043.1 5-methyltetrahydropteroyltriglutamate--homocysteine S-methyltransferase [Actinomycetospora sp. NBRC 106375]